MCCVLPSPPTSLMRKAVFRLHCLPPQLASEMGRSFACATVGRGKGLSGSSVMTWSASLVLLAAFQGEGSVPWLSSDDELTHPRHPFSLRLRSLTLLIGCLRRSLSGGEMHVLRIAIPANLTYEEGGFSLALEGMSGALSSLPSRV